MRAFGALSFLLIGCVVPDVAIEGKPCPCPDGYACDGATQTCTAGASATTGSAGGGSPSGSTSTSASTGAGACAGRCGTAGCSPCPEVAVIDAGGFGVDATEVSRGAYATFLADAVDPGTQGVVCTWNTTFQPTEDSPDDECEGPYDFSMAGRPIGCVDWCDAAAYCAWAGKRLCRGIGGGTVAVEDVDDPGRSEWFAACSAGGTKPFPYGDVFDENACNTSGNGGASVIGGLYTGCEGGFPGVFDMVGNVEEWEDACDLGADSAIDNCYIRGGAFWSEESNSAKCAADPTRRPDRNRSSHDWGFRCCSDL